MARYLVLDWDQQQLNIVSAQVKHGSVRVEKAWVAPKGASPNPADAEALGQFLRDQLKSAGVKPAPVLACVGRDRVIFKDLYHPPATAAEEPALVRFQVVRELTEPPDEVVIDYTGTGETDAAGRKRALAVILRRDLLGFYQKLCQAAGLKLAGMCPRVFGTAACLRHALNTPASEVEARGVLTIGHSWVELAVVRGEAILLARSLPTGPALSGEVRRNFAVYRAQPTSPPVAAVYASGGPELSVFCEHLQGLLGTPVQTFDPFAGANLPGLPAESRGVFAGAVGLLRLLAERRSLPINFAQPKEPKPVKDPNRRKLAFAAALGVALLFGIAGVCYAMIDARDHELAGLFEEKTDQERLLTKLTEDVKRVDALDEWNMTEIVWLDELYDLADRVPDPTVMRLIQFNGDSVERLVKTPGKTGPYVGKIALKGVMTNDLEPINQLQARLVQDGHYRVEPKTVAPNRGAERFRFPQQFNIRMDAQKQPPSKFLRRLPDKPAGRDRRGGDFPDFGGGFGGFGGGQP